MDTQQIIKERYKSLPPDVQKAITSSDLGPKFNAIADKYALHIDQNGSLQTETMLVMLGLEPSADYVGNLKKELEITEEKARSIAEDVNKEILAGIRATLRTMEEGYEKEEEETDKAMPGAPAATSPTPQNNLSSLEKVGNFVIEKPRTPSNSPQYNDSNLQREKVLKDIEDAEKTTNASFVNHLLGKPAGNIEEVKEIKKAEEKPAVAAAPVAPKIAPKDSSLDPYREPFN